MLTKKKVLALALALTKAGDSDLLEGNSLFSDQTLNTDDIDRVKEIGNIIHDLCRSYSYVNSREHGMVTSIESVRVADMKTKMESSPIRKRERLEALYASIRNLVDDPLSLRRLVREDQLPLVSRIVDLLGALSIPKG
jgi:hypothetical protein